ncbi:hypothetical protein F0Q45_26355 [Mycobacterium simiae]|uniref:Uncharacterized protein n=1 Tax=Mycobacterium simiae TaxID=1784 RepID=A0A5B1B1V8_MYCSI|nr:hypothetical protein [Mycobacterium simiae]KAA1242368.1 hypothetical protein F0Q45_26355 [Mycobacterium simiae]
MAAYHVLDRQFAYHDLGADWFVRRGPRIGAAVNLPVDRLAVGVDQESLSTTRAPNPVSATPTWPKSSNS